MLKLPAYTATPNWDMSSDTVTRPSGEMLAAMLAAPVGDDVFHEDPTVVALEQRIAALCNKPAALFCTSSTLSNQLAIRTHLCSPPESLICHAQSHIFQHESAGASMHSQAMMIPVAPATTDNLTVEDVRRAFVWPEPVGLSAPTNLVALENTLSGALMPIEDIRAISEFTRAQGAKVHLDGSRLWNAAVAEGRELSAYATHVDSLNLCLSKGMGCPVGAMLVGDEAFIERARRFRKAFGGGWRQAGILAAAGLYAIEHVWPTMRESHRLAKKLADALAALGFVLVLPPDTNMVVVEGPPAVASSATMLIDSVQERGVRLSPVYQGSLRIVLHHQISEECVDIVIDTARRMFG
ncbi:Threonine aldolase [Coemansia erecta]|uniref:Threonine aldolase n=1 Tax=Coemansia erecta TaxID=147472 RepID=A0A9W8CRE5_9FUNG|nr:Threonine aldolase [Coemansia erecta]